MSERPEFVTPRTPQKLPSILKTQTRPANPRKKNNNDKIVKGKKLGDHKSRSAELISNEPVVNNGVKTGPHHPHNNGVKTDQKPPKRQRPPRFQNNGRSKSEEVTRSPRKMKKSDERAPSTGCVR